MSKKSTDYFMESLFEDELLGDLPVGHCEGQCERDGVVLHRVMSRAHPNPVNMLCFYCAVYEDEYWDEMWREYYASVL